jgi:hypothetical protein
MLNWQPFFELLFVAMTTPERKKCANEAVLELFLALLLGRQTTGPRRDQDVSQMHAVGSSHEEQRVL